MISRKQQVIFEQSSQVMNLSKNEAISSIIYIFHQTRMHIHTFDIASMSKSINASLSKPSSGNSIPPLRALPSLHRWSIHAVPRPRLSDRCQAGHSQREHRLLQLGRPNFPREQIAWIAKDIIKTLLICSWNCVVSWSGPVWTCTWCTASRTSTCSRLSALRRKMPLSFSTSSTSTWLIQVIIVDNILMQIQHFEPG